MNDKLFLGVADDNHTATAVVGDGRGKIVATSEVGSVNFRFCGLGQARQNLKNLIIETIGWRERKKLAMVSFTYQTDCLSGCGEMCNLVEGMLGDTEIQVTEFTSTCTLGVPVLRERMVLIGGPTGVVVFDDSAGLRFRLGPNFLAKDLFRRIAQKLKNQPGAFGLEALLNVAKQSSQVKKHKRFAATALAVNQLGEEGNPLALEIMSGVAHDLIRLVTKMARRIRVSDPVIGLYGTLLLDCTLVYKQVSSILNGLYPQAKLQVAPLAPAKGAYLSGLRAKKLKIDQTVLTNLLVTLNNLRSQEERS